MGWMEGAGAGVECLLILPGNAGNTVAGARFLLVKSEK